MINMFRLLALIFILLETHPLLASNLVVQHPHYFGIDCVALSDDSKLLATANARGEVKIWDSHSGQLLQTLFTSANQSETLRFDSSHRYIGLEQMGGAGTVWEWRTGRIVLTSTSSNIVSFDFVPETETCVVLEKSAQVKCISLNTGNSKWSLKSNARLQSIRCLGKNEAILIGFAGELTIIDLNKGDIITAISPAPNSPQLPAALFSVSVDPISRSLWLGGHSGLFLAKIPPHGNPSFQVKQLSPTSCFTITPVPDVGMACADGSGKLTIRNHKGQIVNVSDQIRGGAVSFSKGNIASVEKGRWKISSWNEGKAGHPITESQAPINYGNPFLESSLSLRIDYDRNNHVIAFLNRDGELFTVKLAPGLECRKQGTQLKKIPTDSQISFLNSKDLVLLTEKGMTVFDRTTGATLSQTRPEGIWDSWALRGSPKVALRTKEKECITYQWTGKSFTVSGRFPTPFGQAVSLNKDGTKGVVFRDNGPGSEVDFYNLLEKTSKTYPIGKGMNIGGHEVFFVPPLENEAIISTHQAWKKLNLLSGEVKDIKAITGRDQDLRILWEPRPIPGEDQLAIHYHPGFDDSFSVVNTENGITRWRATHWSDHEKIHKHHLLGFSPNHNGIWSCGADGRPVLWDLKTGKPLLRLTLQEEKSGAILETPQGSFLTNNTESALITKVEFDPDGTVTCSPIEFAAETSTEVITILNLHGY